MKIEIQIHELFDGNFYGVAKHMSSEQLAARVESTKLTDDLEALKAEMKDKVSSLIDSLQDREEEPELFEEQE